MSGFKIMSMILSVSSFIFGMFVSNQYPHIPIEMKHFVTTNTEHVKKLIRRRRKETFVKESQDNMSLVEEINKSFEPAMISTQTYNLLHNNEEDEEETTLDMYFGGSEKISDKQMYTDEVVKSSNQSTIDAAELLPQEINKDWFDPDFNQIKEIPLKNLINVNQYAVSTVNQTLKNASHDIRGSLPNPRTTVSPFLNSSYEFEYDNNITSWCN